MNLDTNNYLGLDHTAVNSKFTGGLTYISTFCVGGEYRPSAVYKVAKPDRKQGHKPYLLLTINADGSFVRGMTLSQLKPYGKQDGIHCKICNQVVYSAMRHQMKFCACQAVSIDGGKNYTKISYKDHTKYEIVTVNLLTLKVSKPKKKDEKYE